MLLRGCEAPEARVESVPVCGEVHGSGLNDGFWGLRLLWAAGGVAGIGAIGREQTGMTGLGGQSRARLLFVLVSILVLVVPGAARADAPYPRPEATSPAHPAPSDPYDYEDYTWIDPGTGDCSSGTNPPDEADHDRGLPENVDCKNDWKDTNYAPKPGDQDFDPTVTSNPAEMGGVKGSRHFQAWEVSTGRPDTVIAVMDSGIKWDGRESASGNIDQGELNELNSMRKKFYLNPGELPVPGPAGCGSPGYGGHDRNCDGMFNVVDYQSSAGCSTNCVTDVNNNTMIEPQDLILTYSDTVDDDDNGYPDDISGWDFFENDNDANDDVDYGHGTGESLDSGSEAEATNASNNNVRDTDGLCPNCMLLEMRVGDSFIADVNHWAEATVYATDNGASVVQEALGTLNNTSFGQAAADYAYRNGVVIVASAADESAAHHNYPSNYNHTMIVNSVHKFNEQAGVPVQHPKSFLYLNGCTNFGGHIHVAIPSSSCSSDATGHAAGQAGVLYSAARNAVDRGSMSNYILDNGNEAPYPLSAEEAMQMFRLGADDINFSPPNSTTGYTTEQPVPSKRFQSTEGWDMFFGYGRTNVNRMLRDRGLVPKGTANPPPVVIPPEADITSPAWFAPLPDQGDVAIEGRVAANRVTSDGGNYDYVVEWAPGVQDNPAVPAPWTEVAAGNDKTAAIEGQLATLDMETVAEEVAAYGPTVFDPATDPTSRDLPEKTAFRVRVTVTDSAGGTGVFQEQFFVTDDPDLLEGFPKQIGSDGAGSPAFADLNGDNVDELVLSTANGEVHAYDASGDDIPGWPVHTDPIDLPASGDNAYTTPGDGIAGPVYGSVLLGSPAIGDIVPGDGGDVEVAAADLEGKLYVWNSDGTAVPDFPVTVNWDFSEEPGCEETGVATPGQLPSCDDYLGDGTTGAYGGALDQRDRWNTIDHGFNHNPVLANIDPSSPGLEILAGSGDNHVYAWRSDGSPVPGWPIFLRDPAKVAAVHPQTHKLTYAAGADPYRGSKVVVPPSVGDVDNDGDLEVAAAVNEEYEEPPNASRIREQLGDFLAFIQDAGNARVYLIDGDGTNAGPSTTDAHPNEQAFLPGWPARIAILSAGILPYVGEGADGSPTLADIDGDGDLEIGIATAVGPGYIFNHDGESYYGEDAEGRDITLATDEFKGDGVDAPSLVAVGGGTFGELEPGVISWAAPTGGLKRLLDIVLNSQQLQAEDHISAWNTQTGSFTPGFPSVVNDLQFFNTPSMADVSGDGIPEVLEGTAVYDVRAVNSLQGPAPGWPKFTGGWTIATVGVGDIDGDQLLDVATVTREGWLYVWETEGDACQGIEWSKYQHDLQNTGNHETPSLNPSSCLPVSGDPAPSSLELSPDQASNKRGEVREYTAVVRDENGDPVEGAPVEFEEEGAGEIQDASAQTDEDGEAKVRVTSSERGNQTITASTTPCAPTGDCSDTSLQRWGTEGCDIYGTEGNDTLTGTPASETICGFGGDDVIKGLGGNDRIRGHQGIDTISGASGADAIRGGSGDDELVGGSGDDTFQGAAGADELDGKGGSDKLVASSGNDDLVGGPGVDVLRGRWGDDDLAGGSQNDYLRGSTGNDDLDGGSGKDDCEARPGKKDSERRCEI